jgi:hypothetical protein
LGGHTELGRDTRIHYYTSHTGRMHMSNDNAFFGTILALMALLFGHPIVAVFIFFIGVLV